MRIAVISDIHSNIYALEAVLADIEKKDVDLILCTGDLVGYHTRPNEVVELIKDRNILSVKGNHDKVISSNSITDTSGMKGKELQKFHLRNYGISKTAEENKAFLRALPEELVIEAGELKIKLVHGSPRLITEYLRKDSEEADLAMKELAEDVLICGHTHLAYFKHYGEKLLVNAGSIGKPKKGIPDSEYVILEIRGKEVSVSIENVSYDYEKMAKELENSELPAALAEALRSGK